MAPVPPNKKRIAYWCLAALMLLVSLYAAMGVLQAGSIYEGERALRNFRFWGSITLMSLLMSIVSAVLAICSKKTRS